MENLRGSGVGPLVLDGLSHGDDCPLDKVMGFDFVWEESLGRSGCKEADRLLWRKKRLVKIGKMDQWPVVSPCAKKC